MTTHLFFYQGRFDRQIIVSRLVKSWGKQKSYKWSSCFLVLAFWQAAFVPQPESIHDTSYFVSRFGEKSCSDSGTDNDNESYPNSGDEVKTSKKTRILFSLKYFHLQTSDLKHILVSSLSLVGWMHQPGRLWFSTLLSLVHKLFFQGKISASTLKAKYDSQFTLLDVVG